MPRAVNGPIQIQGVVDAVRNAVASDPLIIIGAAGALLVLVGVLGLILRRLWRSPGDRFRKTIAEYDELAILMHPNPDPDAMACAMAVGELAAAVDTRTALQYPGEIRHQENRAFETVLDQDFDRVEDATDLATEDVVLVDHNTARGFRGAETLEPVAVVDHHPGGGVGTDFTDVRTDNGACASILSQYFEQLDWEPTPPEDLDETDEDAEGVLSPTVATGLIYGIQSDTAHLTSGCSADEFDAAAYLYAGIDEDRLDRIANPEVDAEVLDVKARAITERDVRNAFAVSDVGTVSNVDAIPQAADELLRLEGVTAVVVLGDRDGDLHVSGRSRDDRVHMGKTLSELVEGVPLSDAGGHARMGGAKFLSSILARDGVGSKDGRISASNSLRQCPGSCEPYRACALRSRIAVPVDHAVFRRAGRTPPMATPRGTRSYREAHGAAFGRTYFRPVGELSLSSIGIGTYLGEPTDAVDADYVAAIVAALEAGCNVVDTAINYRHQRSERAVGRALDSADVDRDAVFLATKGGFIPFDATRPEDPARAIREAYIEPGLVDPAELARGHHCLAPGFIEEQVDRSLANLDISTIDLYYIHNPETQLEVRSKAAVYAQLEDAFAVLEQRVAAGDIGRYGVATWTALRVPPEDETHLSLAEIEAVAARAADRVGHERSHLAAIQLPFNVHMADAFTVDGQSAPDGEGRLSTLEYAAAQGLSVFASATLHQGQLARSLPDAVADRLAGDTPAQRAINFTRSAPAVTAALVGSGSTAHATENVAAGRFDPLGAGAFDAVFE